MKAILAAFTLLLLCGPALAVTGFTGKDAAQAIGQALIKEGAGDEVRVQINGIRDEDILAPDGKMAVTGEVSSLQLDKPRNRWEATLMLGTDGQNLAPVKFSGKFDEMQHVPTLKQRMQPSEIITEQDIVWDKVPSSRLRKSTVMDTKSLIGKSPKRVISAGRPIRLDEIAGPTIITKGAQVTLIYKTPTLEIKTLGEAMENGTQGAVIKVRNTASKSIIQGVVEGEGRVRIGSPEDLSARLM